MERRRVEHEALHLCEYVHLRREELARPAPRRVHVEQQPVLCEQRDLEIIWRRVLGTGQLHRGLSLIHI